MVAEDGHEPEGPPIRLRHQRHPVQGGIMTVEIDEAIDIQAWEWR